MKVQLVVCLMLTLLFSCEPEGEYFENAICIEHVSIIDAKNNIRENMTVIIQNERIVKIAKSDELALSSKNKTTDATGKYLIPGLWDAHIHFAYIEELAPQMFDLFIAHGITSVRDTGGKIEFVKKWQRAAEKIPSDAPRVMIAGPLLDGMPNVYDGSSPKVPPLSVGSKTVDDAMALVEELDSIGVDLLKAYEMLSPEQFEAVIALAKKKNLKVTGHVPLSMDVITASNLGLSSMEHLRNLEMATAENSEALLEDRLQLLTNENGLTGNELRSQIHTLQRENAYDSQDEEKIEKVLNVLVKNQTWQIPTLALNTGTVRTYFKRQDWINSFELLPEVIAADWKESASSTEYDTVSEFNQKRTAWTLDMLDRINKKGIPIIAGTDTPIFYLTPGLSLHEELAVLVEAGLTPMEALETATLNPAKYFDMEDELGLVEEGYLADLLLLDANPLDDIKNTKRINLVIKNGKFHTREYLDMLLQKLKGD